MQGLLTLLTFLSPFITTQKKTNTNYTTKCNLLYIKGLYSVGML